MRVAIIENGKVVNVEMADDSYRPSLGRLAVPSDTAAVGDTYDGKKFVTPLPPKETLLAHVSRRATNDNHMQIIVPSVAGKPSVRVFIAKGNSTAGMSETTVSRLAQRAEKNSDFTVPVPQPRNHKCVTLNGAQFIALNEAITDWYIALNRAHDSIVGAIKNGQITSPNEINNPPSNCFPWPKRYWDLSAEDRAKHDISVV